MPIPRPRWTGDGLSTLLSLPPGIRTVSLPDGKNAVIYGPTYGSTMCIESIVPLYPTGPAAKRGEQQGEDLRLMPFWGRGLATRHA